MVNESNTVTKAMGKLNKELEEKIEERTQTINHLKLVLHTLRSINQLIITEKDPALLIQNVCNILIGNHGYFSAWVAIMNQSGGWENIASAGFGVPTQMLEDQIMRGELPPCAPKVLSGSKIISIEDKNSSCSGCPLLYDDKTSDLGAMTVRLEHAGKTYGLLSVTISKELVTNEDEQLLFKEFGDDIALALFVIEQEKERKKAEKSLRKSDQELTLRNNIAEIFLTSAEDEIFSQILKYILTVMESKHGFIGYIDPNGALVIPDIARIIKDKSQIPNKDMVFPRDSWGDNSWSQALQEKKVIYSNETSTKVPNGHITIRRHISVPIIFKEESIGLIQVANKETNYGVEDVEVLKTITSYIAPILHARIQKEIWEKEHRQAVRELKRSEESLAQAQRIAFLGNWDLDLINNELRWSDEIYRIFGLKPQEFGATYEAFLNSVHPDDREYVDKAYTNSVKNNTPFDIVHRIVRPDGEIRYVHEKAEDIKDETGRTIRSVGTVQDITERKLVEEELMLTQFTMNNAVDAAFWIGPDARFTYINETACQSLGYSREELLTMTVHDIDPNFPEEAWRKHWTELREKGSITLESKHRAKNGTTFPVEIKAHYLEYDGKEYNVAFASDITERRKVEEARKISEERLRRFMESATDAFSIWDSELNLVDLNEAELKMFPRGTTKKELIGSNIRVISPGIENTNRYDKYRNVIETGEPFYIDEFIVHPRFGSMHMSIRAFKVGDGMGLITTDITERIMAVKALQESEELNRSIIETATDAFIGMDSCGLITDWNKQAERIFGIPHKDAIGRSFAETILAPAHGDIYISEIGSFMATGRHPFLKEHVELTAIHNDGHEFPVQIKVWPIKLGEEYRFNAFVEDISERMNLQKMKDEFVSTASHELRTPLTTMKEGISQIAEGILGPTTKEQDEFLNIILEDINRLTRIINDLLDMSRIDAEMVSLKIERVDLFDLVNGIFKVFNPRAVEKGLEIRAHFPKERVKVNIDRDKILQVFTNLLDNSIKYTPKGHIDVTVSGNGNQVECSISDTGKGIPEDELLKIFDKFQQFGKMKNPKEKGSGLGLYIVKKIVELHNGEIRVESQLNKGSKFSFTLPKSQIEKNDKIKSEVDP